MNQGNRQQDQKAEKGRSTTEGATSSNTGSGQGDRSSGARPPGVGGSDVAPTARAQEREQERHRLERELGRTPAGEAGLDHDYRSPDVTRAKLDEAARQADINTVGHPIGAESADGPEDPADKR